ncbi:MAG: SpoIIE family protein phosphatase [SAR324 cluster bacterium]|nr:SpoIIE family protein phosphatase [SAR324 cluster bacterium]
MTSTILVVDDEIDVSELIELQFYEQIASKEFEFFFAINGTEALDTLEKNLHVDMVISDINMPGMSGLTLLKKIDEEYPAIKTVVVSAYGDMENIRTAMNCGAFDFLIKPMNKEDLLNTINKTLNAIAKEKEMWGRLEQSQQEKIRIELELKTAAAMQQALFPKILPQLPNLKISSFFKPASEVGGDWYGFMTYIKDYLYVLIGDVTGHGIPAALVAATASATCTLSEYIHSDPSSRNFDRRFMAPSALLDSLNKNVYRTGSPNFLMTFFVGCLDLKTGLMRFCNAAHNFPIVIRPDRTVKSLLNANLRLGEKENAEFTEGSIQLEKGDLVFFYTDGLIENENSKGEMWGESRLKRYLKKHRDLSADDLVDHLVTEVYDFFGGQPLSDDMTMIACQISDHFGEISEMQEF